MRKTDWYAVLWAGLGFLVFALLVAGAAQENMF